MVVQGFTEKGMGLSPKKKWETTGDKTVRLKHKWQTG